MTCVYILDNKIVPVFYILYRLNAIVRIPLLKRIRLQWAQYPLKFKILMKTLEMYHFDILIIYCLNTKIIKDLIDLV
jgi:hypothetical protein